MLNSISIKNVALINDITITLGKGLNVITGETGAGKSLVIGSISLLLGDKADRTLISYDKDYAFVEAVFFTENPVVFSLMESFGLEKESTIVVSRKIYKEGKNECRVNGKTFTLSMLKKLMAPLMDLHGQFEHQSILDNKNQLFIIDGIGGKTVADLRIQFESLFADYQQVNKELESFTEDDAQRNRLIDLYDFQINEITEANFVEGEEEKLKEYRQKVINQEKIAGTLENAYQLAEYGQASSGGVLENISKLMGLISSIKQYDQSFDEIYERLNSSKIEFSDIIDSIAEQKDGLDFDEYEAKINEERLDLLSSFKKKYGKDISQINEYLEKITTECNRLKNSEQYISELKIKKQNLISKLQKIGKLLTDARKVVSKQLEEKIHQELADLAMKNTKFVIEFSEVDIDQADISGLDKVEYMFSANAGQPPKPLNKIISGGEMSRFMLAVKNITSDIESIDTMIFDEIDTGVSGFVAEELAKKLLTIGTTKQVICVSHLSQVASYATHHYYINKKVENGKTSTYIKQLTEEERINEVARLIGGTISQHSIDHAKFMRENRQNFLKTLN